MIKINALANYDVCKVLADKFVISGLSITTEDIDVDGIDGEALAADISNIPGVLKVRVIK
mgnify:CR=1 FL=1